MYVCQAEEGQKKKLSDSGVRIAREESNEIEIKEMRKGEI